MALKRKPNKGAGSQWVTVYITHNLPEAHIILGKLRAHDLPAMLHQEAGATALGITYGNLGEIKILVAPADYDRAEALLFPASGEEIEANNDKIRLIWDDEAKPAFADDDDE